MQNIRNLLKKWASPSFFRLCPHVFSDADVFAIVADVLVHLVRLHDDEALLPQRRRPPAGRRVSRHPAHRHPRAGRIRPRDQFVLAPRIRGPRSARPGRPPRG